MKNETKLEYVAIHYASRVAGGIDENASFGLAVQKGNAELASPRSSHVVPHGAGHAPEEHHGKARHHSKEMHHSAARLSAAPPVQGQRMSNAPHRSLRRLSMGTSTNNLSGNDPSGTPKAGASPSHASHAHATTTSEQDDIN